MKFAVRQPRFQPNRWVQWAVPVLPKKAQPLELTSGGRHSGRKAWYGRKASVQDFGPHFRQNSRPTRDFTMAFGFPNWSKSKTPAGVFDLARFGCDFCPNFDPKSWTDAFLP